MRKQPMPNIPISKPSASKIWGVHHGHSCSSDNESKNSEEKKYFKPEPRKDFVIFQFCKLSDDSSTLRP